MDIGIELITQDTKLEFTAKERRYLSNSLSRENFVQFFLSHHDSLVERDQGLHQI